jgi:hypothetical protein
MSCDATWDILTIVSLYTGCPDKSSLQGIYGAYIPYKGSKMFTHNLNLYHT